MIKYLDVHNLRGLVALDRNKQPFFFFFAVDVILTKFILFFMSLLAILLLWIDRCG